MITAAHEHSARGLACYWSESDSEFRCNHAMLALLLALDWAVLTGAELTRHCLFVASIRASLLLGNCH